MKNENESKRKNIHLTVFSMLSLCATMLVICLLCGMATLAWFASNRNLNQINGEIGLGFDDTTADYTVYKYDIRTSTGKKEDNDGNPLKISNIVFNQYDLIFLGRNRYTPIFARIEVKRSSAMPEEGTVYLTIERTPHDNDDQTISTMTNYCSSIMRFTGKVSKAYDEDANVLYNLVDKELYDITKGYKLQNFDHSKVFTSVSETTNGNTAHYSFTKTDSIKLAMPYSASDWMEGPEHESILNIYLYMTYDEGLIEYYKDWDSSLSLGSISIGSNVITFANDLAQLKVSYKGVDN